MKKILFFLFLVSLTKTSLSQSISYRSNGVVTVSDMRLQAEKNFFVPRYNDTTEANLNKGIDSCGALIFSRDVNAYYYRACSPKKWTLIAAATGGNPWTLAGNSDAVAGSNFLGTTNNVPLEFRIKNVKSGLIDSATRNTTIGFAGQRRTTTATNNASFGWRALDSVTTGGFNTAIGTAAMKDNVSGTANTAIGYAALNQTKRAFGDVAIGFGVLARDSFGFGNVGIGYDVAGSGLPSKPGIDTMQYNTMIGYRAGYNQKGGRNNVFIGKEAGRNDTTGVGNIFIGRDAGKNQIGSNKLMISNSDTSFPLINGDFSNYTLNVNGKLSVGNSSTPDSALTVNGGVRLSSLYPSNNTSDSMLVIKSNGGLGYRQVSSGTANAIDSLKQSNDSVFARKNSQFVFQYKNAYDTVYTQSPIMSMVSGDSNIIFFNADTANAWRGNGTTIDTTSLSNRIDLKLDSLTRRSDSVFAYRNGTEVFQFKDSVNGTTPTLQQVLTQGSTVTSNNVINGNTRTSIRQTGSGGRNADFTIDTSRVQITNQFSTSTSSFQLTPSAATMIGATGLLSGEITANSGSTYMRYKRTFPAFSYEFAVDALGAYFVNGANQYRFPLLGGTTGQILKLTTPTQMSWVDDSSGGGGSTDTTSLSNRINQAFTNVTKLSDTSFFMSSPSGTNDTITLNGAPVYVESPIMARVSGDSNIIFFNADTANAWRGGSSIDTTSLSNRIDSKIDSLERRADSIYAFKNGQWNFQYKTVNTNTGGGASVNYYLNGSVSQGTFGGTTYYQLSKTPIAGAGTNFTRTSASGNGYIASFITDVGDPNLLNIPGGNWNLEFYFNSSSSGGTPSFYGEIYKVSATNVFTLIASGSTNPEGISNGTVVDQYFTSIPVPQTTLLATDRIAIRIFVTPGGRNITLHTEDNNLSEVLTTFSTGLNALNGLTTQVQYFQTGASGTDFNISSASDMHTFNIPNASTVGVTRGLVSNAELSAKLNASDTSVFQRKFLPANSISGNNTFAPANATSIFFKDTSGTYTGTPVWSTSTPGGATTHTYRWTRVGNMVTLNISLVYGTASANNTTLLIPLPADCPTPLKPTGFSAASNYLYSVNNAITGNTVSALTNAAIRGGLRSNAANNGFEMFFNFSPLPSIYFHLTINYYTN